MYCKRIGELVNAVADGELEVAAKELSTRAQLR
jgi:hypothetical protein